MPVRPRRTRKLEKSASVADAPNIGVTLGRRLQRVGIDTVGQLEAVGDEGAFARVTEIFPDEANVQTRLALAGAVRGVRWTKLSKTLRSRLTAKVTGKGKSRATKGLSFEQVAALGLKLKGVETAPSYGTPALKLRGRLLARLREDRKTVVVKTSFDEREVLLGLDPRTFFVTDHYLKYPWVVVRLATVKESAMRELLERAHRAVSAELPERTVADEPVASAPIAPRRGPLMS